MNKKANLVMATLVGTFLCGLLVVLFPRNHSLPSDLAWSTEHLTPEQAEVLSDTLIDLGDALEHDININQGRGADELVTIWQSQSTSLPSAQHIGQLLHFTLDRGPINLEHLTYLGLFAHYIDDMAEEGAITIASEVSGSDIVILIQSPGTGKTKHVVMTP